MLVTEAIAAIVFGIVEILLKMDFHNDFLNIIYHNLQDLEGASCYLVGVKKLNSL